MNLPRRQWPPIALLAIGIAAALAWWSRTDLGIPDGVTGNGAPATPSAAVAGPGAAAGDLPRDSSGQAPTPAASLAPSDTEPVEAPHTLSKPGYELELGVSIRDWMDGQAQRVREATVADFERNRERATQGGAEAAYWLHLFYLHCEHAPRADWQLDNRLSSLDKYMDRTERAGGEFNPDHYAKSIDAAEVSFRLCSFLGPDFDAGREALEWLETAADLGHMGAQRLYHSQARRLIADGFWYARVYQEPELIPEFKLRAARYADALLKTDHPQAYLLMARMLTIGDVYEQDHAKAYAYARAAELVGIDGVRRDAQRMLDWIAGMLDPSRIPDAEKMAHRILRDD